MPTLHMEEPKLTTAEIFYLCLATGAGTVFALTLGYLSWEYDKSQKK